MCSCLVYFLLLKAVLAMHRNFSFDLRQTAKQEGAKEKRPSGRYTKLVGFDYSLIITQSLRTNVCERSWRRHLRKSCCWGGELFIFETALFFFLLSNLEMGLNQKP